MKIDIKKSEKGQAIVYLVLGLVVFLGFVALAIDGGMALADRRNVQNAADASSLAGGAAAALKLENLSNQTCGYAWSCSNQVVVDARSNAVGVAIKRAVDNHFNIDDNISDHNGVNTSCGDTSKNYIDVMVEMSATTQSNFLQLVYPKALHNEVVAVTEVDPGGPVSFGNAIVALNPELCSDPGSQGIIFGGSSTIAIVGDPDVGADVFSNGCLRQNGDKMTVVITNGVAMANELIHIRPENWDSPPPTETDDQVSAQDYKIDQPTCPTTPANHNVNGNALPSSLESGLWCITGDLIINQSATLHGSSVTLLMLTGKLIINGPADVQLTAPPNTYSGTAIPGVLIYMSESPLNSNVVTLNGNQTSVIGGLIYAPHSYVTLSGTGGNTYSPSQVIGWDVELTGNSKLFLYYNSCSGYLRPPSLQLNK